MIIEDQMIPIYYMETETTSFETKKVSMEIEMKNFSRSFWQVEVDQTTTGKYFIKDSLGNVREFKLIENNPPNMFLCTKKQEKESLEILNHFDQLIFQEIEIK